MAHALMSRLMGLDARRFEWDTDITIILPRETVCDGHERRVTALLRRQVLSTREMAQQPL